MPTGMSPVTAMRRASEGTGEKQFAYAAGTAWLSPTSSPSSRAARAAAATSSQLPACSAVS